MFVNKSLDLTLVAGVINDDVDIVRHCLIMDTENGALKQEGPILRSGNNCDRRSVQVTFLAHDSAIILAQISLIRQRLPGAIIHGVKPPLVIPKPKIERTKQHVKVSLAVTVNGKAYDLWYKLPPETVVSARQASDAFLCLFILPGMKTASRIEVEAPVSPQILTSADTIQDIFRAWWVDQGFEKVPIKAKTSVSTGIPANQRINGVATCFSGGVDSFYTLLKHSEEITHLFYIYGFDIPLEERAFQQKVRKHLLAIAQKTNKELVEVETNVQTLTNDIAEWGRYTHGSAIASVAHLLGNTFSKLYVPSSGNYKRLNPFGSHPLLDHQWSSESLEFVYDGAEFNRIEKVDVIRHSSLVLQHLRVCWQSNDAYNCSVCEKCRRTMASLEILGCLDKAKTFNGIIDYNAITTHGLAAVDVFLFAEESLNFAQRHSVKNRSVRALEQYMKNHDNHVLAQQVNARDPALYFDKLENSARVQIARTLWLTSIKLMLVAGIRSLPQKVSQKFTRAKKN